MNVCTFTGNISRKAEMKNAGTTTVLKFTVAVNRKTKDDKADFVGFTAFGKTAEFVDRWCKVGTKVCVRSHYQQGSYVGKDGKNVYTHDFIVDELEKMSSKADDETAKAPHYEQASIDGFAPIGDSLNDTGLPFN